jgi:hypothetical protein
MASTKIGPSPKKAVKVTTAVENKALEEKKGQAKPRAPPSAPQHLRKKYTGMLASEFEGNKYLTDATDAKQQQCFIPLGVDPTYQTETGGRYGTCSWCKDMFDDGYWLVKNDVKRPVCVPCAAELLSTITDASLSGQLPYFPQLCIREGKEGDPAGCSMCHQPRDTKVTHYIRSRNASRHVKDLCVCKNCWKAAAQFANSM